MVLYGFAFLLIETRFVTAMSLLWGATWLTSAVVFGSILAVILMGTILRELKPIRWPIAAVGLVLTLLVSYALPLRMLLSTSPTVRLALSLLWVRRSCSHRCASLPASGRGRRPISRSAGTCLEPCSGD